MNMKNRSARCNNSAPRTGASGQKIKFLGALAPIILSACMGQGAFPSASSEVPVAQAHRLNAGETIRITTYGEESMSGDFAIGTDGVLAFPLIGGVKAAGLTPEKLAVGIQNRLAEGFLLNPRVSVEVKNFKPVYVLGEVNKPGEYVFVPGMTLMAAIAKAEGFTYRAQQKRVFIRRAGENEERELTLNSETEIAPGDTLRVAERYF